MSSYPEKFVYTKQHEWVDSLNGIATIGITEHAQAELGDIVFVDLPKVGTRIEQGKALGSVESVKAVSDIYAPVSGEVLEVNEQLTNTPEKLNEDPHGVAWLLKVQMSAPEEIKKLLTASDYQTYVGAES